MTETRFTWRWLIVIALVGIFMGLAIGLAAGWIVYPNIGSSNIAGLSASAQQDYIILVANTYAYDGDAVLAKRRLAQLQDGDIKTRVERLAKALAARKDPSAANVADLAIELGSEDSSLQVMAEQVSNINDPNSDAEPTKSARSDSGAVQEEPTDSATGEPTATVDARKPRAARLTQTAVAAQTVPATPEPTTADEPQATDLPATSVPATREPTTPPTAPAPQPAPVTTEFIPSYPGGWWDAVKFIPADVAPGQQYWHLKYARYCDWAPEERFNPCEGFPGGGDGVGIWIMTVDEQGACVSTPVTDILNDGSQHPLTPDMLKDISFAWNPYGFSCNQDYEKEMYGEGNSISVPGLPSDKITELQLCAKNPPPGHNPPPCGHAHVRYFLIFQRTTR
jgi:hypothetical protein